MAVAIARALDKAKTVRWGRDLKGKRGSLNLKVWPGYTLVIYEKEEPRKDICSQDGTAGFTVERERVNA